MSGTVDTQKNVGEVSDGCLTSMTEHNITEDLTTADEQYGLIEITYCEEIFTCKACNVSGHGTRFSEHLMKHLLRLPYKCLHCSETFAERKQIGAHMQKEHPGQERRGALRANKRASVILDKAAKRGFFCFKSNFVHILQNKETRNSDESNSNKSSICTVESKNAQEKNLDVLNTKDQVLNRNKEIKTNSPKFAHSDLTFSHLESKDVPHTDDSNRGEEYEEMSTLQREEGVNSSQELGTGIRIDAGVLTSSANAEDIKCMNPVGSSVSLKAQSSSCHLPSTSTPLVTAKDSVNNTHISESTDNRHDQCSFDGSLNNDHTYDSHGTLKEICVNEATCGNIAVSENGKAFINKPVALNNTCEKYQDIAETLKAPLRLEAVDISDDTIHISSVDNNISVQGCKNNSLEKAKLHKRKLLNTAVETKNNVKQQTVTTGSYKGDILTAEHKPAVSSTLQLEQDTAALHNDNFLASKSKLHPGSIIQLQPCTSLIQPSQQIITLVAPNISQYAQKVQSNTNVSSIVPLTGPALTLFPVANVQGFLPLASPQNVATATGLNFTNNQSTSNVKVLPYNTQQIIIKDNQVLPISLTIAVQDTSTRLSKTNKESTFCVSKETVVQQTQHVSEALEKTDDNVFKQKGVTEKKTDILIAIVGNEYLCGKCRLKWKQKELFWFHLWNHQHIGGILCKKCVRIDASTGLLSCAFTDSIISLLEAKQQKINQGTSHRNMKYIIMKVDHTSVLSTNKYDATVPTDENQPQCATEGSKLSLLTDENGHNKHAEEAESSEQQADDNSTEIGLKILECKTLNMEEFEGISVSEENSADMVKTNIDQGIQEKTFLLGEQGKKIDQEQGENVDQVMDKNDSLFHSDSLGSDNLEKIVNTSSNIDDLISEVQKCLPSESKSYNENMIVDKYFPDKPLDIPDEQLDVGVKTVSDITVDSSITENSINDIFSQVQAPAYHFYVCGRTCSFSCLLSVDFRQHLLACKFINREALVCFHCGFVGQNLDSLMRHMHKHAVCHKNVGVRSTNAVFMCSVPNCKFSTNILNAFYGHCCHAHPDLSSHTCVNCEQMYPTVQELAQHLKDNLLSVVSCKHCMAKDVDKNIVMEHILFEHPGKGKMLNTVKQLLCNDRKMYGYYADHSALNVANVATSQANSIEQEVIANNYHKSDESNTQQISKTSLKQQTKETMKSQRSFSEDSLCCQMCSFVASDISALKQHLACHEHKPTGCKSPFVCPVCSTQVETLKHLEDHAACHAENVSFWLYGCPHGDYQTNQVTLMLQHVKQFGHLPESGINLLLGDEKYITSKVIACTCCKFKTTNVAHLDEHMKGHSIILSKDPAVKVAAHSTSDVDITSESVHKSHSQKSHSQQQKKSIEQHNKDESKSVKNTTKQRFSSVNDASKLSNDSVIYTVPCSSIFQIALACPQCSFSAHFKATMLTHIRENHPSVQIMESSPKESSVQTKSTKIVLPSSTAVFNVEHSDCNKLKGMKIGSSELDKEMVTFYKTSGPLKMCKMCGTIFSQKKFLHHHILHHLKLNLWKCNFCDFKDNRRFIIMKHAKHVHSNSDDCVSPIEDFLARLSEHKCMKKTQKFGLEATASDDPLCNAEIKEALKCFYKIEDWCLECIVCKVKCNSVLSMHKHVLQSHLKCALFGCTVCWFEDLEERVVLEHMHAKHSIKSASVLPLNTDIGAAVKSFIDDCPAATKSLLFQHHSIKKKKLLLGSDDMDSNLNCLYDVNRCLKLVCLICKEEHSTKYASHRHLLSHLGIDLVGCSCCDFKALSDRDVTEHMKSIHAGIQLKIDYLDVDIADAVKRFLQGSCKISKGCQLVEVKEKRQKVQKSKVTHSTSKLKKLSTSKLKNRWNRSISLDTHMGNKKDVKKKIVGGLTKFKCRFCEYLALSVKSVLAHIFKSHPKTEDNLYKCSKCPFQVESLVEIKSHMFQKHPWSSANESEDCHPSPIVKTSSSVYKTDFCVPSIESETSDNVHSTSSCSEAEASETFSAEVSSTRSHFNYDSTNEALNKQQTDNCAEQADVDVAHSDDDQVTCNKMDDKSSGPDGDITDNHHKHDKDTCRNLMDNQHKNPFKMSIDKEMELLGKHMPAQCVYSDISDADSMEMGEVVENNTSYPNSSTSLYVHRSETISLDNKKGVSCEEYNRSNQFSDISDDESFHLTFDPQNTSVESVCVNYSKDNVSCDQGAYSDISDEEMFVSAQEPDKTRNFAEISSNKKEKEMTAVDGDDKKENLCIKQKDMKQKVSAPMSDGGITSTKKAQTKFCCIDSNNTETISDVDDVDIGRKEKLNALFQCSRCHFITKNNSESFACHLKEAHNILKLVQCNYCSARYTDINTVKRHMNFFHKDRCKNYQLLPLSFLFKEVKHKVDKEELAIPKCVNEISVKEHESSQICKTKSKELDPNDNAGSPLKKQKHKLDKAELAIVSKCENEIPGKENKSSQFCKTKSKKMDLNDKTSTPLKKPKRISPPTADADSSMVNVDENQIPNDKNKGLSFTQKRLIRQKHDSVCSPVKKKKTVMPTDNSSSVKAPLTIPASQLSDLEACKSSKDGLFSKKKDPSNKQICPKDHLLKQDANKKSLSVGFISNNKIKNIIDGRQQENDEHFKYKCKYCKFKENDRLTMKQHLFNHWHYKPYICSFCLHGFVSSEKHAIHAKVVHENIVTFCQLKKNKEIEASVNKMLRVLERVAKRDQKQKMTKMFNKSKQDECFVSAKKPENLEDTSCLQFKCFYCPKSVSSLEGLRIHFGLMHGDILKKRRFWIDGKTGQMCNMSGAVFVDASKVTYRRSFLCGYCSRRSRKRSSLIKHQRFDHSKKIAFIVNLNNAQRIDAHIKLSSNPRVLEMSEEPVTKMIKLVKSSPDKNEMGESSAKAPAPSKPSLIQYCCNLCGHKERSLYHYRRHLAAHGTFRYLSPDISQTSALRCGCCNYFASDEKDFSKHVECHVSGQRPYQCGYCSYDAFNRCSVRSHHKSVHTGVEKIIDRSRSTKAISFETKPLVDIEPVVRLTDIMTVPTEEFGDLLLKHGVSTIDLSYIEDDKMFQILKLFGSGIPEDQLYHLLN